MRLMAVIRQDLLFQFRHGFYWAYLLISLIYIAILRALPVGLKPVILQLIVFTDTAVLGFFFIGGLVLLEKSQGVLNPLFVTPLTLNQYLISKTLSLTLLSVITSLAILLAGVGVPPRPGTFILAAAAISIFFIQAGFIIAARAKNLNGYFALAMLCTLIIVFPLADFFGLARSPLFYLFPTQASLMLLKGTFERLTPIQWIYALGLLSIGIAICFNWAKKWFSKYVLRRTGE